MLLFNLSLYFYHWAHILVLCPAVYSTAPFRGLIRCCIFCKWWRHRCDISANKALFPPPLSIVPNIKLHSCIFLKWQRGQWENTERGSARKLSSLSRFSAESDSRLATSLRKKKETLHYFLMRVTRITWSVWGVSGCPGPRLVLVWMSPEESDLGSISPGTPYRFAWRTEGETEGLPSVSNKTITISEVFFSFPFLHPPSSFWIHPHVDLSYFHWFIVFPNMIPKILHHAAFSGLVFLHFS